MKLLIPCDEIQHFAAIVDDLRRAGVGSHAEALVLSVADVLPPPEEAADDRSAPAAVQRARARIVQAVERARQTAETAAAQLRDNMPGWTVTAQAAADAPAWAIVNQAEEWQADLIVVGAGHHSLVERVLLGSVSQTVLHHARRSVRIARAGAAPASGPARLLVGIDGSANAAATVPWIAARSWPAGSQVRLVCALDETLASTLDAGDAAGQRADANARLAPHATALRAAGLEVSTAVIGGDAKHVLLDEAERWQAHCVFLGARGLRAIERLLLGSVSATVAARAACSVEIVRA
jgi:nucleotide-binding universal stress UspA family protein